MIKTIVIAILSILSNICFAQSAEKLKSFANKPMLSGGSFSLKAVECSTGEVVYDYRSDKAMTPASVLKLVTTATAIRLLGADYKYKTSLLYTGTVADSMLLGNIYVKGSGDPSLGSSHISNADFMDSWVEEVSKLGIKSVKGSVISDESCFDQQGISLFSSADDLGNYYAAGSYGLNVYDNSYNLYMRSGSKSQRPWIVRHSPADIDIHFDNQLYAGSVRYDSVYISGFPFSNRRYLYGIVQANKKNIRIRGDIPEPALYLAKHFSNQLCKQGISVEEEATCYRKLREQKLWKKEAEATEFYSHSSPSLSKLATITNHKSHNLYADAMLKSIGNTGYCELQFGLSSYRKGIDTMLEYWKGQGLDTSKQWILDGSGLSRATAITAGFLCDVLREMHNDAAFVQSIPRAGREGTVANMMKGTNLEGKARLKSGGMTRVKSYAGYIESGGKTYAVAVIANNYSCNGREMTKAIGHLLVELFP